MQPDLKEFYEANFIPEHVRLLLGLHGVVYPVDLSAFGAEDIKEIEEEIRSGGYDDKVDFNDESNQTTYLGTKIRDIKKFRFTSIDRRKLMAIGAAAISNVAQNIGKEPRPSLAPMTVTDQATSILENNDGHEVWVKEEPTVKKVLICKMMNPSRKVKLSHKTPTKTVKPKKIGVKGNSSRTDLEIREAAFTSKAFTCACGIISSLEYNRELHGSLDESNVIVEYNNDTDRFSLSMKCLFCPSIVKCKSTEYEAADMSNFKRHVTKHDGRLARDVSAPKPAHEDLSIRRIYYCTLCQKSFVSTHILDRHIRTVHEKEVDQVVICPICGMRYISRQSLKAHMKKHAVHKCPDCPRTFSKKCNLKQHAKGVHVTERNFKCSICDGDYKTSAYLNQHLLTHREPRFTCDICGASYVFKRALRTHCLRNHTNQSGFLCSFCPKSFATSTSLYCHLRIHTQEKNKTCQICGAKFRDNFSLGRHIRSHGQERTQICQICAKRFKEKYNLVDHLRKIHGHGKANYAENFECVICDSKFDRDRKLKHHLSKVHFVAAAEEDECNEQK